MGIPPIAVLDVCVPSSVFLLSNIKKVENGETARGSVVFAQGAKIAQAVAKYHDATAKNASEAFNIFGKYAEKYKALDVAGKGVNWATRNVNPLICASAVYKTATSDDKVRTGIGQLGALSGMFLGEGLMKCFSGNLINEENVTKLAENMKNSKGLGKIGEFLLKSGNSGKVAAITKGIAFVCASMTSYSIGEKLGNNFADEVCANTNADEDEDNNSSKLQQPAKNLNRMV